VLVCERLAADGCARLRRHDPKKGALAAWLTTLVRNTAVDWIRSRAGRRRLFGAIERLDPLDQRVFELFYWERQRPTAIAEELTRRSSPTDLADVFEALGRIEASLTDRHRSDLLATLARSQPPVSLDADAEVPQLRLVDPAPDPEAALGRRQSENALALALQALPPEDAAIVRLMFVNGWSRDAVKRALHLAELPRERIAGILRRLRDRLADGDAGIGAAEARRMADSGGGTR
jgi:DNA-directed RNA polymerase specialized sigma24 family protein